LRYNTALPTAPATRKSSSRVVTVRTRNDVVADLAEHQRSAKKPLAAERR
jgi:hypothetical protein